MNKISLKINNKLKLDKTIKALLKNVAKKSIKFFNLKDAILDIYITTDEEIKTLNKEYRAKNKPTDVLSFVIGEYIDRFYYLGEVIISYETANLQAKSNNIDIREELTKLLVHGIIHLMGYDHELSLEDEKLFFQKQNEILKFFAT